MLIQPWKMTRAWRFHFKNIITSFHIASSDTTCFHLIPQFVNPTIFKTYLNLFWVKLSRTVTVVWSKCASLCGPETIKYKLLIVRTSGPLRNHWGGWLLGGVTEIYLRLEGRESRSATNPHSIWGVWHLLSNGLYSSSGEDKTSGYCVKTSILYFYLNICTGPYGHKARVPVQESC